jgi:acetoin utilization deacetylase AcuC-like enzyme
MTSDLDVVLEENVGDEVFLERLSEFLEIRKHRPLPGLILFQTGVDTLETDRLGHLSMTPEGIRKRNDLVYSFAEEIGVPLVITMGGGYGEPIETSVASHADVFRQAVEKMA